MDRFSVAGRTACVTGTSGGLGRQCADALAVAVIGVARREAKLVDWTASGAGKRAYTAADLMDEARLEALRLLTLGVVKGVGWTKISDLQAGGQAFIDIYQGKAPLKIILPVESG